MKIILDWRWSFRLLPEALQELRIAPQGVIHVGAHRGEEVPIYLACGFETITLVEPDPANCDVLAGGEWINTPGIGIVNRACGSSPGRAVFHRAESTAFSGLIADGRQEEAATFAVDVIPVSAVQATHRGNVVVIDTQGTELDVLESVDLASVDLIVIETQPERPGSPGAFFPHLQLWAERVGWTPRIQWQRANGWADTLLTPARLPQRDS